MPSTPEFDHPTRGRSYSHANDEIPTVRSCELSEMVRWVAANPGERILEFGAGNGLLTERLLAQVGATGRILAMDNSRYVCSRLRERFPGVVVRRSLREDRLPVSAESCDAVASLANFHHVHDSVALLREFARCLVPEGRLVIGDVADGTPVQRYFDEVVDKICSTGHQHPFLDESKARRLCDSAGLTVDSWSMLEVPWQFRAGDLDGAVTPRQAAGWFLKTIHDAQCSAEECFELASEYLEMREAGDVLFMSWQLFFLVARRSAEARAQ